MLHFTINIYIYIYQNIKTNQKESKEIVKQNVALDQYIKQNANLKGLLLSTKLSKIGNLGNGDVNLILEEDDEL